MTGHSTGVTPGYLARVRRNRMLARLGLEADRERIKAEIAVHANQIISVLGKDSYDTAVDQLVPEDASFEQTRDVLAWLAHNMGECNCYLPEMTCPACQAAATEGLEEGEIPCL